MPELMASACGNPDVAVRRRPIDWSPPALLTGDHFFELREDEAYLYWESVGTFAVRGGREILVDPLPDAPQRLIRLPLLGTVLSVLLHQRGYLVLHAGAVSVDGGVVAFMGHKGSGKSTTVGALHARGHNVVTDDNLAVDVSGPVAMPAFPQLKLWPDAAASLGINPDQLPRLHNVVTKRSREIADGFERSVLPLRCVYVLDIGEELAIEPVTRRDSFVEVMRHTRYLTLSDDERHAVSLFPVHARLVSMVPMRRLIRKVSLDDIGDVARAVEADVAQFTPSQFSAARLCVA